MNHGYALLNGMNTNVACTIAALFYQLLQPANKDILDKVKAEIEDELLEGKEATLESLKELITRDSIKNLDYLEAVLTETLRISPPIYGKLLVP